MQTKRRAIRLQFIFMDFLTQRIMYLSRPLISWYRSNHWTNNCCKNKRICASDQSYVASGSCSWLMSFTHLSFWSVWKALTCTERVSTQQYFLPAWVISVILPKLQSSISKVQHPKLGRAEVLKIFDFTPLLFMRIGAKITEICQLLG